MTVVGEGRAALPEDASAARRSVATHATSEERPLTGLRYRPSVMSVVGLVLVGLLLFWLGVNLVKTPDDFLEISLIGLTIGAVYALVALGYTLVYGILELINFAHGDVFMLGAMMCATFTTSVFGLDDGEAASTWLPARARDARRLRWRSAATLNATIELARLPAAAQRAAARAADHRDRRCRSSSRTSRSPGRARTTCRSPSVLPTGNVFTHRRRRLPVEQADRHPGDDPRARRCSCGSCSSTKQGKAMRATAQDKDAAAMMGINVNRTISFTFVIAGALAGAAGLLYALYFTNVRYDQGFQLGLIAFTAAVLGGIGNLPGRRARRAAHRADPGLQRGPHLALARQRLDAVDRLLDPDPDPRLPPRGPARRADAGGRLDARRSRCAQRSRRAEGDRGLRALAAGPSTSRLAALEDPLGAGGRSRSIIGAIVLVAPRRARQSRRFIAWLVIRGSICDPAAASGCSAAGSTSGRRFALAAGGDVPVLLVAHVHDPDLRARCPTSAHRRRDDRLHR